MEDEDYSSNANEDLKHVVTTGIKSVITVKIW